MKKFIFIHVCLLMLLNHSFTSFAFEKIGSESVYDGENYYINPAMVYLAPNGMFLNFEGECIPVNTICYDASGIYIPASEMSRRLVWCPICQRWREPNHTCSSYK